VIVTSIEGIVAVVVGSDGFARIWVSPLQPAKSYSGGGASAVTVTTVPAAFCPLPLPSLTVRVGVPGASASVRVFSPVDKRSWAPFFAPGTGVLSKTESDDGNKFARSPCNRMSCEEEPTRILNAFFQRDRQLAGGIHLAE